MRRAVAAALGLILVAAAPAARADDAGRLKVAQDVVQASGAADSMRALTPTLLGQMKHMLEQQPLSDPKQVDLYVQRFEQRLEAGIPDFVALVAQVYAREFTEEDLSALLAFYRSTAGQHFVAKQAEIGKAMFGVGQQWGKGIAGQVLAEMQKQKANPPPKL